MLTVAGGQQVMLKVRIAEMDRSIAKQFGVNLARRQCRRRACHRRDPKSLWPAGQRAQQPVRCADRRNLRCRLRADDHRHNHDHGDQQCQQQPGHSGTGSGQWHYHHQQRRQLHGANNAQGILKALEQVGLVHMLAEPNLTAVSGETAKFLAGGEFPVPAGRDQQGNISIEFKQFGVGLSFTPVVLSPGRISLQLSTEVSELTNTGAFTLQGANRHRHRPSPSPPCLCAAPRPLSNCPRAAVSPSPA